jgi:hypothetical protein
MARFERQQDEGLKALLIVFGVPLVMVGIQLAFLPLSLFYAWVSMHLWNWFCAPYLGLKQIGVLPMYGLHLWIGLQKLKVEDDDKSKRGLLERCALGIALYLIVLGTGYCLHVYMSR